MADIKLQSSTALLAVGMGAMTVGSDVVTSSTLALALAVGGGFAILLGGLWQWRILNTRNEIDERFLQIGFRSAVISFWTLLIAVMTINSADDIAELTPVLEPLTWATVLTAIVFVSSWSWYNRVM